MLDRDDLNINQAKENYDNIVIPDNIDDFILKGMSQGKKQKKKTMNRRYKGIAAALTIGILVTSIRISPAFASYLSNIPVLDRIIQFIKYDKGLKHAVDNGLLQEIGVWDEHQGIKFTLHNVIADKARIVVLASLENDNGRIITVDNISLTDKYGKEIPLVALSSRLSGKFAIEIVLEEDIVLPDEVFINITAAEMIFKEDNQEIINKLDGVWSVSFKPVISENVKITMVQDVPVEIDGFSFVIKEVISYPTRMELSVDVESFSSEDKEKVRKILTGHNFRLIDEKGNEYKSVVNAAGGSFGDKMMTKYLQSNYFMQSKELYLAGTGLILQEKSKVIVDISKREIIETPYSGLEFKEVITLPGDSETKLVFSLPKEQDYDVSNNYYNFDWEEGMTSIGYRESDTHVDLILSFNQELRDKNIIDLRLYNYPGNKAQEFKIRVK